MASMITQVTFPNKAKNLSNPVCGNFAMVISTSIVSFEVGKEVCLGQ
jgi:hypothetical protein